MAFGGPNSAEEVEPFLQNVLGQGVSVQRLNEAKDRYRLIGGRSPLLDITLRQARGLENRLNAQDLWFKVYVGMRHWHPFIAETLREILNDGIHRVIGLSLSPFQSKLSTEPYLLELRRTMATLKGKIEISLVKGWHTHPLFLQALVETIQEGLLQFPVEVRHRVHIIFSAHSLPKRAITGDLYVEQIEETIRGIMGIVGSLPWRLAFQSAGSNRRDWLGPEASAVLRDLMGAGHREVLIMPVGFVSDNVETLYDIDILNKQQAESMGMVFRRSPCLNDCDRFIEALFSIVHGHLSNPIWRSRDEMEVGS
ncbi:MAG: ferrochelatase [Syntrophobacterales bacterium]|nr:MAG: ferrochelatase [Syntrophobacterales bacterium]